MTHEEAIAEIEELANHPCDVYPNLEITVPIAKFRHWLSALQPKPLPEPDGQGWWWEWTKEDKCWYMREVRRTYSGDEEGRPMLVYDCGGMDFECASGQWFRCSPPVLPPAPAEPESQGYAASRKAFEQFASTTQEPAAPPDLARPKSSWDIACEWYGVDEIRRSIQSIGLAGGPGEMQQIPPDVGSRAFSMWLTEQYRLAMNKGIQLGREGLQSAIDAATGELRGDLKEIHEETQKWINGYYGAGGGTPQDFARRILAMSNRRNP